MHPSVMNFVWECVEDRHLSHRSTLEVGSLNVNGTVRDLFSGPYHGVDMRPGSGVDQVLNAHDLDMLSRTFEVVVSTEMLEHDSAPWLSIHQMARVCEPGGFLILTCRGYGLRSDGSTACFPVHDYPADLWRFSVDGLRSLLVDCLWNPLRIEFDPDPASPGVLALAVLGC